MTLIIMDKRRRHVVGATMSPLYKTIEIENLVFIYNINLA